jgi:hypothetical protein
MKTLVIELKKGGAMSYDVDRIKTPRAALALVYEALHRGAYRYDIIKSIQFLETHLGLQLGAVFIPPKAVDLKRGGNKR